MPRSQRLSQSSLVQQPAPRAIDNADPGLGLADRIARQNVPRRLGQRRVQRNEIRARQQLIELKFLDPQIQRSFLRQERIIGRHLHMQPDCPVCHDRTNIPAPDQTKRLARQFHSQEAVLLPLPRLGRRGRLGNLSRQRKYQRQRMLGRRDRVSVRRIHHHHTPRCGRFHIDVVHTDPGASDNLELGCRVQQLARHLGSRSNGQRVELADDLPQLRRRQSGLLRHIDPPPLEHGNRGRGQFVADQHLGHHTALRA